MTAAPPQPKELLNLEALDSLVEENLPGRPAVAASSVGDAAHKTDKHAAKAAVYESKIAKFKNASKAVASVGRMETTVAAPQPRELYSGHFGNYEQPTKRTSLLRRVRMKSGLMLKLGAAAEPQKPDPWAGFVMPETMSSEEEDNDSDGPRPPRSGEQLWRILRAKWKIFQASRSILGTMRTLHGTAVNGDEDQLKLTGDTMEDAALAKQLASQRCCFFVPDSPLRQKWDLLQVLMILYVGTLIPYREAFEVEVDAGSAAFWLDVVVDLYFIFVRGLAAAAAAAAAASSSAPSEPCFLGRVLSRQTHCCVSGHCYELSHSVCRYTNWAYHIRSS